LAATALSDISVRRRHGPILLQCRPGIQSFFQQATCGRGTGTGLTRRQSKPSSNIENCADDNFTVSFCGDGQKKPSRSSRLWIKTRPVPS
jgi:hypothetical protein